MTHYSIKNVLPLEGHDKQGLSCSLYANNEKIADIRDWGLSNLEYSNENEAQLQHFFTFIDSLEPEFIFDRYIPVSDWAWVYNLAHKTLRRNEFERLTKEHVLAALNDEIFLWSLTEDEENVDQKMTDIEGYIYTEMPDAVVLNKLSTEKAFKIWEKTQFSWTTD